jgi:hypothetical protein
MTGVGDDFHAHFAVVDARRTTILMAAVVKTIRIFLVMPVSWLETSPRVDEGQPESDIANHFPRFTAFVFAECLAVRR